MRDKAQLIKMLREVFNSWEELLAAMSQEQITAPQSSSEMSVKDVLIHLWAWQQCSVARMEAALNGGEPDYAIWCAADIEDAAGAPDSEEGVDLAKPIIYNTYRDKPWPRVYAGWRAQFLHFLELSEKVPEEDMLEPERYGTWMEGYALSATLSGSYEHHAEHLEQALAGR